MKKIFLTLLLLLSCSTIFASVVDGKFSLNQVFAMPGGGPIQGWNYWRGDPGFLGLNSAACALSVNNCDRLTTGALGGPRDASNINLGFAAQVTSMNPGDYIKFFNNGNGYSYGRFSASGTLINDLGPVSFIKISQSYIVFRVDNWYESIVFTDTTKQLGENVIITVPLGSGTSASSWNPTLTRPLPYGAVGNATAITQTNTLTFSTWDVQHYKSSGWASGTSSMRNVDYGWTWSCSNCSGVTSGIVNYVNFSSDGKTAFVYLLDSSGNMVTSEPGGIYSYNLPIESASGSSNTTNLCCGGSAAAFNANSVNTAKVMTFVNRTTADSQVHIEQIGTQNVVEVNQSGTRNNYVEYYGNGLSNSVDITQTGNALTQANYVDLRVVGNFNSVNLQQLSTGGTKGIFADVSGNNNSLLVQQKDSGSHYAEITLSGGNKNVDVLQQGSASHMAKVNLSGTPTDLSLTQSGSTQNYYSITHNCTTVGGCAKITVTQGQ